MKRGGADGVGLFTWKRRWCVLKHAALSFFDCDPATKPSGSLPCTPRAALSRRVRSRLSCAAAATKTIQLSSICKLVKLGAEAAGEVGGFGIVHPRMKHMFCVKLEREKDLLLPAMIQ